MTKLSRPVKRNAGDIGLQHPDNGDYIVTLHPSKVLEIHRKRSRQQHFISLATVYRFAVQYPAISQSLRQKNIEETTHHAER